jgi:uncharacterized phage protein (TIGR01671 family)
MREIQFRGKRADEKWVFGSYVLAPSGNVSIFDNRSAFNWVDLETVGQFTGLKDVADKEIYEGDIVRVYYNGYEETSIHEVRYMIDESYPAFDLVPIISFADSNSLQYAFTIYTIEVIGNIHDQKEETK